MPTDATGQMIFMLREELKSIREELRQSRGGDLGLEAVRQALTLNGQVFSSAATAAQGTLQRMAGADPAAPHAANPMDDLMRQFMTAAIAKMMNPSDPIETFAKMAQAMSGLGIKLGGAPQGEKLTDKLVMGLVNQLPVLTQHVSGIMESYRRAEELKLRNSAMVRGREVVIQPPPLPPPTEVPPTNGEATAEQIAGAEQMLQYVENKIVEIFANMTLSPEDAAIQALQFIDLTDPVKAHPNGKNLIDEVLQFGQMGLDHIFSERPILKQIPRGERLELFKKAFLENGRRVSMPDSLQPNPNTPPA